MQYLAKRTTPAEAAYYEIGGEHAGPVRRYVVSTAETRDICNRPELLGCEYTDALGRAVEKALRHAPFRPLIEQHPEQRVCVLHYLRGGLNFGIRDALHRALGLNRHVSAFMSSQRWRAEDGRWRIEEDMYRKLQIPEGALVLAGDVVATGITVEHGFAVLLEHLKRIGSSIRHLVFFTIGCHKLEKHLAAYDARFREAFADYQSTHVVYFEGKFKLVDSRTELRIGIPGTDLIRRGALLAPELEASQWERLSYPLERCAIYDAGSRAFDIPGYLKDLRGYWRDVGQLAEQGLSLGEALAERWPRDEYRSRARFLEQARKRWRGLDEAALDQLYAAYQARWPDRARGDDGARALAKLCAQRLEDLDALLD